MRRAHRPRRNDRRRAGDCRAERPADRSAGPHGHSRLQRQPRAPRRRRYRADRGRSARREERRRGGRADRGVREEAAERPLDPRRLLGSRALAGAAAPDARAHRRRHAGQPGVRAAPRRAHGAGQQPGAEAGRHHARYASPERRRDREGRRRGADRHPQGQRQRPDHEGHAAGDIRRDDGAGARRAEARGLGRRDDRAGHDGERHRAARLPDAARAAASCRCASRPFRTTASTGSSPPA